jgi:hypothetical protein
MKKSVLLKCSFLSLLLAAVFLIFTPGGKSENPSEKKDEFADKILLIYAQGKAFEHAFFIEKAEFKTIGGKLFLVGNDVTGDEDNWAEGLAHAVAWDQVIDYRLFDGEEDFKTRMGTRIPPARGAKRPSL